MTFRNDPPTDFTMQGERLRFQDALKDVDTRIRAGSLYAKPIVAGVEKCSSKVVDREDPSTSSVTVGKVHYANIADAEEALKSVKAGIVAWERTPIEVRVEAIKKIAQIMREKRLFLAALVVREAGKPWKEADIDVGEAIDFCDYYASVAADMWAQRLTMPVPGEENIYFYQARGLSVVISPWNFPVGIACGMTVASLITGNGTILKPAEQTSIIAFELAKIILEAGVPPDAFAFLPGEGESIGRSLVESPLTDLICFTGSRAVGLEILKSTSTVPKTQHHIKKVILELGGKNAIIIDDDADLDEAIKGVLYSAFGFAGQKCSACSRVIAVGTAYERFLTRLTEAAADLIIGPASEPGTFVGPIIDRESAERIKKTIESSKNIHKLSFQGQTPVGGHFVPVSIFSDVSMTSDLWQEEIFGPVLAVGPAKTFEEAVALAIDTSYALTGGVYSRSPAHLDYARKEFRVGNLYINRGCTGALVCRQPFGGFKMSGVGSKAGGPDYLLQFVEPRTVSENTMRRGFTPESV